MNQVIQVFAFTCAIGLTPLMAQGPATAVTAKPQEATAGKPAKDETPAATGQKDTRTAADATFMRTAATNGMAEVEHGHLAAQNAAHADVKQFGQRMVGDHGKANDELRGLASRKNVTLPAALDSKHKSMQDKLAQMKGKQFDRVYMAHMVAAHEQAVALFEKEAKGGQDADVKEWAAKTLPILQEHLKTARTVNAKVTGSKPPAAGPK
jgi:putative membrane protein